MSENGMPTNGSSSENESLVEEREKIVILGAGPTAIGALYRIFQLCDNTALKEAEAGGLARTITDDCGFSWDLGVHITGASKYVNFLELLYSSIREWNNVKRIVKADMTHVMVECTNEPTSSTSKIVDNEEWNYVPYPVQNSIPYFPEKLKNQCLADLEKLSTTNNNNNSSNGDGNSDTATITIAQHEDPTNRKPKFNEDFGEFSAKIFGKTIQSIFIRPYNEKVWTVKLEEMSCKWLEGRVPRIDAHQIRRRCALRRDQLELEDAHQQFVFRYPANLRGIGEMWKRIVALRFPSEIFHFHRRAIKIDTNQRKIFTENVETGVNETFDYTTLISTIPITELIRLTRLAPEPPLKYSKVILVGVGLRLPQSKLASQLSWAYYPRSEIIFYRSTVLSNFSSALVPNANYNWSVLCEIGMRPDADIGDECHLIDRTIDDLVSVGMILSRDQVCSRWIKVLHYGYPIPTLNRDLLLTECHQLLQENKIYSRGRFGGWRYEISNQDHSFECGVQVVDRVFCGIPESLYDSPQ